ncbi:MAG TPA: hypothetical protein VF521_09190 [Pyrinomonadaceae bacterium]
MSYTDEDVRVERRVPGWPRRWLVLFGLHDYLLGDAFVLLGLWLRNRRIFWQYVMKVEEARSVREAIVKGDACSLNQKVKVPERGAWRIE